MSRRIMLIAITAIFALTVGACSNGNSPSAPENAMAVSIPVDASGDSQSAPLAPVDLRGEIIGTAMNLSWNHLSLAESANPTSLWYMIYVARDGGDYEICNCTQCLACEICVGCDWSKLSFRITAIDRYGSESPPSEPLSFKRDYFHAPNIEEHDYDN